MILDLNFEPVGQVGINPRSIKIVCDDSFATITAADYLPNHGYAASNFLPTDTFDISYQNYAYGVFLPTFSGTSMTLAPSVEQGDVTLPVVSNHIAKFSGTTGTIADSGVALANMATVTVPVVSGNLPKFSGTAGLIVDSLISPSNAAKTKLASVDSTTVANQVAIFTDTAGTVGTSGLALANVSTVTVPVVSGNLPKFSGTAGLVVDSLISPSDPTKTKLASVAAATTVNQIATFSDTAGTVQSSGTLLSAVQLAATIKAQALSWAGGSASNAFTFNGVTASSIVILTIQATTNPASILTFTLGTDTVTITFSADPGAVVVHAIALTVAQ